MRAVSVEFFVGIAVGLTIGIGLWRLEQLRQAARLRELYGEEVLDAEGSGGVDPLAPEAPFRSPGARAKGPAPGVGVEEAGAGDARAARRERECIAAEALARAGHLGQITRFDQRPYIEHVSRVAAAVPLPARPAAWLHDLVEDGGTTFEQLLAAGIAADTIEAVHLLSRVGEFHAYAPYLRRLKASGNAIALAVKHADLADNLRASCPPAQRAKYEAARAYLLGDREEPPDSVGAPAPLA